MSAEVMSPHRSMGPPHMMAPQPHTMCAFPEPPVRSVYCMPAPYNQINGQKYQTLVYAYGQSRPYMM